MRLLTTEPRFSVATLEPVIISRTALDYGQTPFHYLLGAWKRALEMSRIISSDPNRQADEKQKILAEIRRLCVSYSGLSLLIPDMFGYIPPVSTMIHIIRDAPRETDLCSYLMQDEVKLLVEFLNELAKQYLNDGLIDIIGSTVIGITEKIASVKFNENYRSVVIRVLPCSLHPANPRQ